MNRIISWLRMTDWNMDTPAPYSLFHIAVSTVGIAAALWLAWRLSQPAPGRTSPTTMTGTMDTSRPPASCTATEPQDSSRKICRVLFLCGLLLAAGELYKQLFLYYVIFGTYNWWYFPFQLCSIPMYLCLLLPLFRRHEKMFRIICTFLQDFSLLGGIMALAEPSGLLHPYWTLTMHGLIWHILLVFIGLVMAFSQIPDRTNTGYLRTLPMMAAFCAVATAINIATGGAADMFYISPYYPVTQVVFYQISLQLGTGAGICIYVLCLCAGGYLCHLLSGRLNRTFHFDKF